MSADELPFPRIVRAGDLLFTSGLFSSSAGVERRLDDPEIRRQARNIFGGLQTELAAHGASLTDTLSLLQYYRGKAPVAGYVGARGQFFPKGLPASTSIAAYGLAAADALVSVEAIVGLPRPGRQVLPRDETGIGTTGYRYAVTYGDWIFCAGTTPDGNSTAAYPGAVGSSLADAARIDGNYWFGLPVQKQTRHIMQEKIGRVLGAVGAGIGDIVYAHIHLDDPRHDFAYFAEVWRELFDGAPPVTVISPCAALGAMGSVLEILPIAIVPGSSVARSDLAIEGQSSIGGLGPLARRVGDFVFTSTLAAADEFGLVETARGGHRRLNLVDQTEIEADIIFDRLRAICVAAGGSLDDVVKFRLSIESMARMPAAYRPIARHLKGRAAISIVETGDNAGWLPGCTISADAVIYRPAR